MTRTRVVVGRDVEVVRETEDGVELAGRVRLRPGHLVELIGASHSNLGDPRLLTVHCWRVRSVGRDGITYCGRCR
jgi:hypothetical protein